MSIELIIGIITAGIVAMYALYSMNKHVLANKLMKESRNLQLKINNFRNQYPEMVNESSKYVGGALGELGIEGILSELGISPELLTNPMVKGLISKYAPRVLEQLSKSQTKADSNTSDAVL